MAKRKFTKKDLSFDFGANVKPKKKTFSGGKKRSGRKRGGKGGGS
jgi:hypothetical protein